MLLIVAIGCSEEEKYIFGAKDGFVKVIASEGKAISILGEGGNTSFMLQSNAKWMAKSSESWIKCNTPTGEHNNSVSLSIEKNMGARRMGYVIVNNSVGTLMYDTLTVVQNRNNMYIPDGLKLKFDSKITAELPYQKNGEMLLNVKSNSDWVVSSQEKNDWLIPLTKEGENDGISSFAITDNETLLKRSAYVYVRLRDYNNVADSLLITQKGRPVRLNIITPSTKNILLDQSESKFRFSVVGDGAWKVVASDSWINVTTTDYTNDAQVSVTVGAFAGNRSGTLTIQSVIDADKKDILTLTQKNIPEGRLKDSLALVAIYNSTNGANWTYRWKLEMPITERDWQGISLTEDGRVVDISLTNNNLEGSIPDEIGWLTEMTKIKMFTNKLSGPIPESMDKLVKLTLISFKGNMLSGELPRFKNLVLLNSFDLDSNRITGQIPIELSQLPKLSSIKLKFNILDPNGFIPGKLSTFDFYINPQRRVPGDMSTDYNIKKEPKP